MESHVQIASFLNLGLRYSNCLKKKFEVLHTLPILSKIFSEEESDAQRDERYVFYQIQRL